MLPNSKAIQNNGNLDTLAPSADGVAGMIMTGAEIEGLLALGSIYVLKSIKDAKALGITNQYDLDNNSVVYGHIKDFYDVAGEGAELQIMVVAGVKMSQMLDKANAYAAKMLVNANGRIKLLAVACTPDSGAGEVASDQFDSDVWAAVAKAKELRESEEASYRYCSFIIEGRQFGGNASLARDLRDPAGLNANRVHICIQSHPDIYGRGGQFAKYAAVGLMLGRAAAIPVQRNIGRVKDGPVAWNKAGLSSGALLSSYTETNLNTLNDKGYIFLRTHAGKPGFYFNHDHAACPVTDDYAYLRSGRVMDKASDLVRKHYVDELLDDIELDPETGRMEPAVIKAYQASAEKLLNQQMTAKGEVSGLRVTVDPLQNVQEADQVQAVVDIVRKGMVGTITTTLNFRTSLEA